MLGVDCCKDTHCILLLRFYASICTNETTGVGDEGPLKQRFSPQKNDPDLNNSVVRTPLPAVSFEASSLTIERIV